MKDLIIVTSLRLRHSKDNELLVINDLMLTTDHQLMLQGHCSKCLQDVTIFITLSELWDNCPANGIDFGEKDTNYLHEMHISLPE